jgi:hypothetical protein
MPHPLVWTRSADACEGPSLLSRRACFHRTLLGILGLPLVAPRSHASKIGDDPADAAEIAHVKALGAKAGLAPFKQAPSTHFLGLGNADPQYCKNALTQCEALSGAFLSHFRDRGFNLALPPNRMTVITLKDVASYHALLGENPGAAVGGHYDLETNRLVVFDFRPGGAKQEEDLPGNPEILNLFTLIHETLHLLSYNSGLLNRRMDVPACFSEGLATYGELWRSKNRGKIGAVNMPRLKELADPRAGNGRWIPIADLIIGDALFDKDDTAQLAYAEAWLLVHYLLQRPQLPRFRAYLAKIPAPVDAAKRLKFAEAELGSLKALDDEVKRHAREQLRKGK